MVEAAIGTNGVAVNANLEVFRLGRPLAHDPDQVLSLAEMGQAKRASQQLSEGVDELIARRVSDLTAYQDAAYAARFSELVGQILAAERAVAPGSTKLTEAVARNYYKLLAYKDEYEVARLLTDEAFLASIKDGFTGDFKINFHLAPPLLSKVDPISGHPKKRAFGPWLLPLLRVLAKGKSVRGSWLDLFGYHGERKAERALISEYEETVSAILGELTTENLDAAITLAEWPNAVRGYGPVKAQAIEEASEQKAKLLAGFLNARAKMAA